MFDNLKVGFTTHHEPKRRIVPKALGRFKGWVRELTCRTRGVSLGRMVQALGSCLLGWRGYFAFCETLSPPRDLDSWVRRRLRCVVWKRWKTGRVRFAELRQRGVSVALAARSAGSGHGPWRLSKGPR